MTHVLPDDDASPAATPPQPIRMSDEDISAAVSIADSIDAVRQVFLDNARHEERYFVRQRVDVGEYTMHVMGSGDPASRFLGVKVYTTGPRQRRYMYLLFSAESGELLACCDAAEAGKLRTAAASAVATDVLANPGADTLALIGTGRHMVQQVRAISAVRPLAEIRVFSRRTDQREAFSVALSAALAHDSAVTGAAPPVTYAIGTAAAAVRGADIVTVITDAAQPVLHADWLTPGVHINAAGSNRLNRRELDEQVLQLADCVVVDDMRVARVECGDLFGVDRQVPHQGRVLELVDVLTGTPARLRDTDVTVFESQGVAFQDLAIVGLAYSRIHPSEGHEQRATGDDEFI